MEFIVLQILMFLRPIMFIELGGKFFGLNVFELFAVAFSFVMVLVFLTNAALQKRIALRGIDLLIVTFTLWCGVIYLLYLDHARLESLAKWVLPLLTFVVAKNILGSDKQYRRLLLLMILGFSVPVLLTAVGIVQGTGVEQINYWTKWARYQGVYANSHNMGHNMAFLVMLILMFIASRRGVVGEGEARALGWPLRIMLASLAGLALFCAYFSYVRTALAGLAIFVAMYVYFLHRRLFVAGLIGLVVLGGVVTATVSNLFYDVVEGERGVRSERTIASGRPYIWGHNWDIFRELPLDRQIAGAGIGNKVPMFAYFPGEDNLWDSHNDYLEVLMETGFVGLLLYLTIHVLLLLQALRLHGPERYAFFAFLCAVFIMNLASNSYITRFGLAQMFYVVVAGLYLPRAVPLAAVQRSPGSPPQARAGPDRGGRKTVPINAARRA